MSNSFGESQSSRLWNIQSELRLTPNLDHSSVSITTHSSPGRVIRLKPITYASQISIA